MASLSKELLFLIIQFLKEEKYEEALHGLEKECGFYFNLKYFEEKALAGEWKDVESYLLGFTKVEDNRYSMKIFFELRKQKYLEALDRQDKQKAMEILVKDLKVFSAFNDDLYKELTQLLTLEDFRENEQLSRYGNTQVARTLMVIELKKLIEANPLFHDKLAFPSLKPSRLRTLINQSLNWQHQLCKNPRPNPGIKSLFTDHSCTPQNGPFDPTLLNLVAAYPSHGAPGPFSVPASAANANAVAGWMAHTIPSAGQAAVVTGSSVPFPQNLVPILKRPRTPPETPVMIDYQSADHEQQMKRTRASEEVTYPTSRKQASWSLDDLPRTVAFTLRQGSPVTSMDFHPSRHTLLLVGSNNGEITLWELRLRERLVSEPFKIWDMARSSQFQATILKDTPISVSCVTWSPDGNFVGVAFTKDLIHLYSYSGSQNLQQLSEINAHNGPVNDLAFANPNRELCVVTCGDDKLIKVWDLKGRRVYNFEGHQAPVYSVCPHKKENVQFIFSTDVNGKIKAWLYDEDGSRVDYDAPGKWCKMIYSADGNRLFSCGTKEGEPFLVEWNESEGSIKRTYSGLRKKTASVVQFDTAKNHFLAVGEDRQIKFWDMDNNNVLTSTEAEGGLSSLPRLRFNREGNLLAVTTSVDGLKILANAVGVNALKVNESTTSFELRESCAIKAPGGSTVTNVTAINCKVETSSPVRSTQNLFGVDHSNRSCGKLRPVGDHVQCRLLDMPNTTDTSNKVVRVLYTNAGNGILSLGSNGVHKLWKWIRNKQNPSGKVTTSVGPQDWQPNSGLRMKNDVSGVNLEEAIPCMALSKNDSYVMSGCGGKISLFNLMNFKLMTTFMEPPPAPTTFAFHPEDNNVLAIGMEDSTIRIYNVRVDEVKPVLKGHQKRITGLAFSNKLNILVSSSADAHLCAWNLDTWEKSKSVAMPMPFTHVQFHSDQIRLMAVNETQLAIYDASKMECIRQWHPQVQTPPITNAAYSCNSQVVYATFFDGNIRVFDSDSLSLRCHISPSAYLSQSVLNRSEFLHPIALAVHPHDPNQFAIGLPDGSVKVIEPKESEGTWGAAPVDNGGTSNGRTTTSSSTTS